MIRTAALVVASILAALPYPVAAHASLRPTVSAPPVAAGLTPNGSWTTYHRDHAHTGFDPSAPTMTAVRTTPGWNLTTLDNQVYGEVLVYNGLVYAATLNNTVYALDQNTGTIVWQDHLGTPQGGGWSCGNISLSGILGTMAIDALANRIYAVGEVAGATPTFHAWGLDLSSGSVVMDVAITPPGFDWTIEQQRGAIAVANGYVYVPFGGRAGDCGPYHGWVVAVPVAGGPQPFYVTPGTGAGFWAAGGVVVDDSTGDVFVTSGNGTASGCDANPDGTPMYENDAVVRLSPTLVHQGFFVPNDWQSHWCGNDQDLGSASPLLISPNLLFQSGKWGGGFLLNPNALGGMDGQLYPTPKPNPYAQADTCLGNTSDATFGSFAYAAPFVYVECEGRGIVALNVNTAAPSFTPCGSSCGAPDWNAGGTTTFGPPIVAGGAVWAASGGGLYAFDATTGAQIFHSASFGVNRFVTPTEAGSQVFVPSGNVVRSFTYGVMLLPKSLDFGGVLPGSMSAAQTVTLYNIQASSLNVASAVLSDTTNYLKGTDTCSGAVVVAGGSCSVQVTFKPAAFGTHPATLTISDNGPGSPRSVPLSGLSAIDNQGHLYTLDGYGRIHPAGTAPVLASSSAWGWNIARSLALFPDGQGGYIMDGFGGVHPFGNASPLSGFAYWGGWDIARQIVLAPWSSNASPAGWTLDGYGGVHAFGGAPALIGAPYWGWDIARGMVVLADSTPSSVAGYILDGYGGVHPFGGAPAIAFTGYWAGWDIAHSIALTASATKANPGGWVLDGYGGIHPFGAAPTISNGPYWGWDIARGIVAWTGNGTGGWVLDGYGGIARYGAAPPISPYSRWGIDIAVALGSSGNSTAGLHRAG